MSRHGMAITNMPRSKGVGWFGNGELGAVTISGDVALPVTEDSGQLITQYESLTIEAGATLHPSARCNGWILLVRGDLIVNGHISMDKMAPCLNENEASALQEPHIALVRGSATGGNAGGAGQGGTAYTESWPKSYDRIDHIHQYGGTPGLGFSLGGGFGPGGGYEPNGSYGRYIYYGGNSEPRPPIGSLPSIVATSYNDIVTRGTEDDFSWHLNGINGSGCAFAGYFGYSAVAAIGGNGPGGAGPSMYADNFGEWADEYYTYPINGLNGDAYGGGALFIYVGGRIVIGNSGSITANGGNGGDSSYVRVHPRNYYYNSQWNYICNEPGGGAGGGLVYVIYNTQQPTYSASSIKAQGGAGGHIAHTIFPSNAYLDEYFASGQNGADGTVVVASLLDYVL